MFRVSGAVLLASLGAASSVFAADEATSHFTTALTTACQPWIEGAERNALSARLQADGWNATADAVFGKSDTWGRVTIAFELAAVKRECRIQLATNDDPWSTAPAVAAAVAWIATTFPMAEKKNAVTTNVEGQPADAALWSDGKIKITQIVFKTKQSTPNSDVILQVANE